MLQRKLQEKKWKERDEQRTKEFIYSLIKGTADTDSFMLAPARLVLESLQEEALDATDETMKLYIEETINDIKKDIDVPDQVFFGLIDGMIKGPFMILPKIYAEVSLTKDIKIIRKKTSL